MLTGRGGDSADDRAVGVEIARWLIEQDTDDLNVPSIRDKNARVREWMRQRPAAARYCLQRTALRAVAEPPGRSPHGACIMTGDDRWRRVRHAAMALSVGAFVLVWFLSAPASVVRGPVANAQAQQQPAGKVYRIGFLSQGQPPKA